MAEYLALGDFLGIAEVIDDQISGATLLDNDEVVARARTALSSPFTLDERGQEVFPDLETKAAVLAFSLIRERPLPRRNIEMAHECMKEFLRRNGLFFDAKQSSVDPVRLWSRIADGDLGVLNDLIAWVRECV